ncbi:hypothetical protein QBC47DRAFT_35111 [Echria macrotheca]|uniref:Uncharacterized protein n=1 Tax=Echria macrotheca TaxID=438768 RepID=A0AAJ0B9S7_9PEZI|nr:hypothetical protein QBC47DRAFT_35111 [Echria macrotheca]
MVSLLKLATITEEGVRFLSPHDSTPTLLTLEHHHAAARRARHEVARPGPSAGARLMTLSGRSVVVKRHDRPVVVGAPAPTGLGSPVYSSWFCLMVSTGL